MLRDLIQLRIYIVKCKANNKLLPHSLQQFSIVKYNPMHVTRQSNKLKQVNGLHRLLLRGAGRS